MDERRQTVQLINYWKKVKVTSSMPLIESFEISLISNKILNSLVIFANSNKSSNKDYHIEFMGEEIINIARIIEDSSDSPLTKIITKLPVIAEKRMLITDQGTFNDTNYQSHKYRSCVLPFGHNKNIASHFIMFISYS